MSVESAALQVIGELPPIYESGTYNAKLLPYRDFYPADGLFHAYLWWASEVAYSTPMYHLGVMLPAVCHEATRRGYKLAVSEDVLRVWTCLLGGSGSGKSTCHSMGRKFYDDFQQQTRGSTYKTPFAHLGGSIQGVKHALMTDHFDQQVGRTLAILENDEVTRFLPRNGGSVTEDLCQMFDGRELVDHTRTAQREAQLAATAPKSLRDYTVQGLFATTPAALDEATTEGYFTGGLFPRLLWVHGKVDPAAWTPGLINWQATRRATALDRWKAWAQWADAYEMQGGARVIRVLPEAQAVFDAFVAKYRTRCFDEDGGRFAPMYMRGVSDHIWRIAGAYAFSCEDAFDTKNLTGVYIGEADMVAATHVVESCFHTFDKLAVTVAVEVGSKIEDKVLALLTVAGVKGCSKKELMLEFSSNRLRAQQALAVLQGAAAIEEYIPRAADGQRNPVGKPTTYYYLAPLNGEARKVIQGAWERTHGLLPAKPRVGSAPLASTITSSSLIPAEVPMLGSAKSDPSVTPSPEAAQIPLAGLS